MMNAVLYYTNTNQSKDIAEFFGNRTGYPLLDICKLKEYSYRNAVLVFPVYCQNLPQPVKEILKSLTVEYLTVIAVYGRMCYGNVLQEVQKKYSHKIIAAAYVPTKHTYLCEKPFCDYNSLEIIIEKIFNPAEILIPKSYKNPLANLFKGIRSRVGVKIVKNNLCNNCGICEMNCHYKAIKNGKVNGNCIRCLRCVADCPNKALDFSLRLPLRLYLNKQKIDKTVVYV